MSADFGDMSAFFDDAGDGCFAAIDLSRGLRLFLGGFRPWSWSILFFDAAGVVLAVGLGTPR
jgi:hypothetical protein